jgi:hypothetical protein
MLSDIDYSMYKKDAFVFLLVVISGLFLIGYSIGYTHGKKYTVIKSNVNTNNSIVITTNK